VPHALVSAPAPAAPAELKRIWRERRTSNAPLDQSGVWRYREIIPFLESFDQVVTLARGPHAAAARAARRRNMPDWMRSRSSTRASIPQVPSKTTA
jgi:hypothetical protein